MSFIRATFMDSRRLTGVVHRRHLLNKNYVDSDSFTSLKFGAFCLHKTMMPTIGIALAKRFN